LGRKARIIGVDLNPACKRFSDFGFEIFIFDQGDPLLHQQFYKSIGTFDALLDDGGHQSFQQIVTLAEALPNANPSGAIIAIEDTQANLFKDFRGAGSNTFLNYSKASTDILAIRSKIEYKGRFIKTNAKRIEELLKDVWSISFYNGLVGFYINRKLARSEFSLKTEDNAISEGADFRYEGRNEASVLWPDIHRETIVRVKGGQTIGQSTIEKIRKLLRGQDKIS